MISKGVVRVIRAAFARTKKSFDEEYDSVEELARTAEIDTRELREMFDRRISEIQAKCPYFSLDEKKCAAPSKTECPLIRAHLNCGKDIVDAVQRS